MKYSILGAGAMGTVFGARLHLAGFEVELLNRSPHQSEAIKAHGLDATIDGNQYTLDVPATVVENASPADVVIIFTKSFQIQEALSQMPPALQSAPVATLQNGLGNGQQVAELIGIERTIEGVSMMPAQYIQHGKVVSWDAAQTWLYHASGEADPVANQMGLDFNKAGIATTVTPEVHHYIWQKACFNIAMNALCALTNGSPGMMSAFPDGQVLAHEIADEAMKIAKASDANLNSDKVHGLIDYACTNHLKHKPSMLQDLDHQRLTEIDGLNGYIVDLADQLGMDAPINRMITRLVRIREKAPQFWE